MEALEQVLEAAIEFEDRGRDYYLEAANRVTDPETASILRSLAHDEGDHAMVIRQYHDALTRAGEAGVAAGLEPSEVISGSTAEILRETVGKVRADTTFRAVCQIARELEVQSREFYRREADKATNREVAKIFRFLAAIEQTHLDVLHLLLSATGRSA